MGAPTKLEGQCAARATFLTARYLLVPHSRVIVSILYDWSPMWWLFGLKG